MIHGYVISQSDDFDLEPDAPQQKPDERLVNEGRTKEDIGNEYLDGMWGE